MRNNLVMNIPTMFVTQQLKSSIELISMQGTYTTEVYLENYQTCKMELFVKIVNGKKPSIIFPESPSRGLLKSIFRNRFTVNQTLFGTNKKTNCKIS